MTVVSLSNPFSLKSTLLKPSQCQLAKVNWVSWASLNRITPQKSLQTRRRIHKVHELGDRDAAVPMEEEPSELDTRKKDFVNSFKGIDGGSRASGETRAEITELIVQLEMNNPTPVLDQGLPLLNDKWFLVYTSFIPLLPLFASETLPLLRVGEISEVIDSENLTSQQSVEFIGPLSTTSFSTQATFQVQSPMRVQINFEQGIIGAPKTTDWIASLENAHFFGQKTDLTPFIKSTTSQIQQAASSVISNKPPIIIPLPKDSIDLWLLVTYLDQDLRITRGNGGSEFVFIKEGSVLLTA